MTAAGVHTMNYTTGSKWLCPSCWREVMTNEGVVSHFQSEWVFPCSLAPLTPHSGPSVKLGIYGCASAMMIIASVTKQSSIIKVCFHTGKCVLLALWELWFNFKKSAWTFSLHPCSVFISSNYRFSEWIKSSPALIKALKLDPHTYY